MNEADIKQRIQDDIEAIDEAYYSEHSYSRIRKEQRDIDAMMRSYAKRKRKSVLHR